MSILQTVPDPPPLPVLPAISPRRPGERHEAVAISAGQSQALREKAHAAKLPVDLAATLLVEAQLAVDWLTGFGISPESLETDVDVLALSAAEADYVRALTLGRRSGARPRDARAATVALPARLVARCSSSVIARAVQGDIELAVRWEVCAMRSGLLIGEWVARAMAFGLYAARDD